MTPLSRDEKRMSLPPSQRRCLLLRKFMLSHVSGLHRRGGPLEIWADPKSCGLFDAPARKLAVIHIHKRNGVHNRTRLQKPGAWIFYPPGGGSEILDKRQFPFDQFLGVQQFVDAYCLGDGILCAGGACCDQFKMSRWEYGGIPLQNITTDVWRKFLVEIQTGDLIPSLGQFMANGAGP